MYLNFFKIALKNLKKNKNILLNSIFLTLFLLLLVVTFSLNKTISNFVLNDNANNLYHRIFFVSSDSESLEEVYQQLQNIKEINQISYTYEYSYAGIDKQYESQNLDGNISLLGVISVNLPEIVDGSLENYENEDEVVELVCPTTLRPDTTIMFDENWQTRESIDTKQILNDISYFTEQTEEQLEEIPYKIIATYDTSVNNDNDNRCYTRPENIKYIYIKLTSELASDPYLQVFIDKYENIEKAIQQFEDLNLSYLVVQETSNNLLLRVQTVGASITVLVLIMSIFIIYLNTCKIMNARKPELYLYRVLGYDFKQIKSILILENVIVGFVSWIGAMILAWIGLKGFQYYLLHSTVGNTRIIVYMDYLNGLLSCILSMIIPSVVVLLSFHKKSNHLIVEMKTDN